MPMLLSQHGHLKLFMEKNRSTFSKPHIVKHGVLKKFISRETSNPVLSRAAHAPTH